MIRQSTYRVDGQIISFLRSTDKEFWQIRSTKALPNHRIVTNCVQLWLKLGNNSSTTHHGTEETINMRQNSLAFNEAETRAAFFYKSASKKCGIYIFSLPNTVWRLPKGLGWLSGWSNLAGRSLKILRQYWRNFKYVLVCRLRK